MRGGFEFDRLDLAIQAAVDGLGVTLADRHMITRGRGASRLVQLLHVEVEGHRSYWPVTRAEQAIDGNLQRLLG